MADVLPERKSERGYIRMLPWNENQNEGTFACSPGTKTGTRVHSPKPPFYETALLSPGELSENVVTSFGRPCAPSSVGFHRSDCGQGGSRLLQPLSHLCYVLVAQGSWTLQHSFRTAEPPGVHRVKQGGRAKPGRFGSFSFAMKNRHFGGACSWILAGKARKCGRFWVFACVPNPGKQSIWRQCPPSARKQSTKKLPNRPGFYPCTVKQMRTPTCMQI